MDLLGLEESSDRLAIVNKVRWYGHVLRRNNGDVQCFLQTQKCPADSQFKINDSQNISGVFGDFSFVKIFSILLAKFSFNCLIRKRQ